MKKTIRILTITAFFVGVALPLGSSASAQSIDCSEAEISNTGPGSVNEILCQDEETVVIKCTNGTIINIDINQDANSGESSNEGNANSGDAESGDAENTSNAEVDVDNACAETVASEEKPETPVTPEETKKPVVTQNVQNPEVVNELPETNGSSSLAVATLVSGAAIILGVTTKFGFSLYSKFNS